MNTACRTKTVAGGLGAVALLGVSVYAATSTTIGVGTFAYFEPFAGPATITTRSLAIAPNEVLGWHQHPGVVGSPVARTSRSTRAGTEVASRGGGY